MPSTTEPSSGNTCPKCGTKNQGSNDHCKKCYWPLNAHTQPDD